MKNYYVIKDFVTVIFLRRKDGSVIETQISTNDLDRAKQFPGSWYPYYNRGTRSFYVYGHLPENMGGKVVQLHRWITNTENGLCVDHIDHDTLNNQRENLRVVTHAQNQQNRLAQVNNKSSGVRGVTWSKNANKWMAQMMINKKHIHIGYFSDLSEAEKAVKSAREKHMPYSPEASTF